MRAATMEREPSAGRGGDPFVRPLDRHLEAQRRAFGPGAYRADPDRPERWSTTCPACAAPGRTATVLEHGVGGPLTFACARGCERITDSAASLERFWVDGLDSELLPPLRRGADGWLVELPLAEFVDLLEAAV